MNNHFIFTFQTSKPIILINSYDKDGLHYLLSAAWGPSLVVIKNSTTLLIQDDSSDFANNFKKNPNIPGFVFSTPTSNLKFIPNFHKMVCGDGSSDMTHGLLIKDNNQIIKNEIGTEERFNQITFKVISENKVKGVVKGDYSHELTIYPLDLGVEGLPPITKLTFDFYQLGPGRKRHPDMTGLEETWLYNHSVLSQSVGKTFTMKVGRFNISDLIKGESGLNCLSFGSVGKQGDFDLASFREKTGGDNKRPNSDYSPQRSPTPPKEGNNKFTSQTLKDSSTLKTVLIVGGFLVGLILDSFIFYLWKKKRGSFKK